MFTPLIPLARIGVLMVTAPVLKLLKLMLAPEVDALSPAPELLPVICQVLAPFPPKFQVLPLSTTPDFKVTTPAAAVVSTVILLAASEAVTARFALPAAEDPFELLLMR